MTSNRYPWKWWLKDLQQPEEKAPTVFSTFACGGGSSMGYKRAGYRVIGSCEIDPKIAKVYEQNLHPKYSYVMDLREFNRIDNLPDELYYLDVLDGSPPCSTFSVAGSRERAWGVEKQFAEGQKYQRLDDLFFVFLDTVEKLRPKVFVAENVTGLIKKNARGYVYEIIRRTKEIGYDVQLFKLNAAFMGVPQKRERIFFIANRVGLPSLRLEFDEPVVTFGEVRTKTSDRVPTGRAAELIRKKERNDIDLSGAYYRETGKRGFFNYNYCYDNKPAYTAIASVRNIRVCDGVFLSDGDLVNISTFPQDYDFSGGKVQFITGMSVPPSMMANIAHEIRTQWLEV